MFENEVFFCLVTARYGSDVEDDSDEESEDENAEVNHQRIFCLRTNRLSGMDRRCRKRISSMLFNSQTT